MSKRENGACHPALPIFDELPNSANVGLVVVCALFGCSAATVWRRVRDGALVAPLRFGKHSTRWNVGALREALKAASENEVHL